MGKQYKTKGFGLSKNSLVPYWSLAVLRVILTFVPQLGYIHPDEFFQSVEIVSGDVLDIDTTRPWEFNVTFPIRSITFPYLMVGIPVTFLREWSPYMRYYLGTDMNRSYMLLVFSRILFCLMSFVTDYSLYKICLIYGQNYKTRLLTLASSFVMLVFGTHTFTNSIELALTSLLIYYVCDCMFVSDHVIYQREILSNAYEKVTRTVDKVKIFKLKAALPPHSLRHCAEIATITVAGIFNRPTFIPFALLPVFFWLQRGLGTKTVGFADFNLRIFSLILCGLPTLILFILVDSFYYGYITMAEVAHLEVSINSFVITPFNFLKYNLNHDNVAGHGIHPIVTHFLVNVPLLYNVLGVAAIASSVIMGYKFFCSRYTELPKVQSISAFMIGCFVVPIALLSLIRHQEARFLIPVTLPVVFTHSHRLHHTPDSGGESFKNNKQFGARAVNANHLLTTWYLSNILLTIFYGFLHQGGVYPLAEYMATVIATKPRQTAVHLVTSHIYSMPQSFLYLPNTKRLRINRENAQKFRFSRQFFIYEMGSKPMKDLVKEISATLKVAELKLTTLHQHYVLYLAIPTSLSESFMYATLQDNSTHFKSTEIKVFYPHLSTEALPTITIREPCPVIEPENEEFCEKSGSVIGASLKYFSNFMHQLGLVLYKIDVHRSFAHMM